MPNYDINNLFGIQGIVAVITGGGSGLGLSIANALDANGAKAVYIIGRRREYLEKAAKEAVNGSIIPLQGDVTSKESLEAVAEQVQREQGFINVLFANSGIMGHSPAHTDFALNTKPTIKEYKAAHWAISMEDFTAPLNVNITSVFYTALAFLELLDEGNRKGNVIQKSNVIVTSSEAGFNRTGSTYPSYCASKAGCTHLGKILATTLTPYKIRVNVLVPGVYPSEITQPLFKSNGDDMRVEGGLTTYWSPLERSGTEEEIAGTALYMAGKSGAYLSGSVILTDGGRVGSVPSGY